MKRLLKNKEGTTLIEFMVTLPLVLLIGSFIYTIGIMGITAYITDLATYDGVRTALALDKTAQDGEAQIRQAVTLPVLRAGNVDVHCSKDAVNTSCTVHVKLDNMFNMLGLGRDVSRTITLASEKPIE